MSTVTGKATYTPEEIVAQWHSHIEQALDPWFLTKECYAKMEAKLIKRIAHLMQKHAFTAADLKNSLRVATDAAQMCKLLQPDAKDHEISFDTFQAVLKVCSIHHKTCQGPISTPGGGGGWCDV